VWPEQRYQAVLAVISDGETVTDVAARFGVSRKTVHDRLARYEAGGLENLGDRPHRPVWCPHQMSAAVAAAVAELRRAHPWLGARRLVFELARRRVVSHEVFAAQNAADNPRRRSLTTRPCGPAGPARSFRLTHRAAAGFPGVGGKSA
jgi:transposase-like protein